MELIIWVLIFIIWILLLVFIIFLVITKATKNAEEITNPIKLFSSELGFTYYEKFDFDLYQLSDINLFAKGDSREIGYAVVGKIEDSTVTILNYKYSERKRKFSSKTILTVLLFESPDLNFPKFKLEPKNMSYSLLFGKHISFGSRTNFLLKGKDETSIRRLFNKEILSFFKDKKKLNIEAFGDRLIVYSDSYMADHKEISKFFYEGREVFNLFKSSSRKLS